MSIPQDIIHRILTEQGIPAELQADETLRAIADSIARLDALRDIYGDQLNTRTTELLDTDTPDLPDGD
ncbi:hypothetical protein LFT45_22595 (plasmid) [Arthrobacter sp. FW305-BF8]|uniref:hypothetical protein n=1 Tax=Arthrobacter sp. FW305-BF8 TaxID=2879617 RepID=UPI001F26326D|nr:hypothetical protein [Arthrobacter sp. FW305-BF8]UKA56670.1 hypothetical protein LFT45_22595 [Arthrobacter sp. FW305-BF8]